MNLQSVMKELDACGTAQNRKVYARHGVSRKMFGVSFANLKALAKKIKTDQALAERLWASGNHDARILATMIADPRQADGKLLGAWAEDLDNYVIADAFSKSAAQTPLARGQADRWKESGNDWLGQAGWNLVGCLAMQDATCPDDYFAAQLEIIERGIHGCKNRTKHAMNNALIAIGLRNEGLREKALAAAARIGTVAVDHGDTDCKTPDAAAYIQRAVTMRAKLRKKRARAT